MKLSKEFIAGFIVLVTLGLFYWAFNFLKGKNLFAVGTHYYAVFDNLNGLEVSRKVKVSGATVGSVVDIVMKVDEEKLKPEFIVEFKLDKTYNLPITKNTIAFIDGAGLTGNASIELNLETGAPLAIGDTISGRLKKGLLDQFTPTREKLDVVMLRLDSTLIGVQKLLKDENQRNIQQMLMEVNQTLVSLRGTSEQYANLAKNANAMINENRGQVQQTLKGAEQTLKSAEENLNKFGQVATKFNQLEIEQTMSQLEESSTKLNSLMTKINNGEGSLGAMVNDKQLYENLKSTSENLDLLVEDFKNHPSRYVQFSIFGKKEKIN